MNDYIKYDEIREGMSPFNAPWRANFPQTINPYKPWTGRVDPRIINPDRNIKY